MKENIAMAWVEMLEGGEFPQGKQALSDNGKFCCLGVLCEMAVKEGIVTKTVDNGGMELYGGSAGYLPREVMEWAGMHNDYGMMPGVKSDSLSVMNDNGTPFKEIAAVIRQNWEKL